MFSNVAISAVAFLVALGVLISIHEFGHFWVARRVGIKVLTFSIGFGKALWKKTGKVDNTEYVLAAIPLGGYVRMLDEREAPVDAHEQSRAFNRQPLWARAAVVIAGPVANFLLAIAAFWFVMMIGISGVAPIVGKIAENTPAFAAGFEAEDRILAVNEVATPSWSDARLELLEASFDTDTPVKLDVETVDGQQVTRFLSLSNQNLLKQDGDPVANLGFSAWWPEIEAVVGQVVPGGAADQAGFKAGDRVLSIDDQVVSNWSGFVELVQPSAGVALSVVLLRNEEQINVTVVPAEHDQNGRVVGRIGVAQTQSQAFFDKSRVTVQYPPLTALTKAIKRTVDMSLMVLRMFGKLIVGQASLDNISGPISIAQYAGQSATIGLDHYINFIALISISLAVLNLLPIPMLDGGHLMYFAIEAVTGKPPSEQFQIRGQQLGIVLLGCLMFIAFYNDIWRLVQ